MRRKSTRAAVAAAVALAALTSLPGTAAATTATTTAATTAAADAGEYKTADGAKPVEGAASSANGPTLKAGETYTDSIKPGDKLYYSVELDAKSDAWVSAVAAPKPGTKVAYADGITVALESKSGDECSSEDVTFGADNSARPISNEAWRIVRKDDLYCQDAGIYDFTVTRTSEATSSPEEWPLELRFMEEPPLAKAGPTTAPDPESVPTQPPPPPNEKAVKRAGGTGFNDAAGIDEGVWSDIVKPGQTRFYRVPLDWGQQLFLNTEFGTTQVTEEGSYASDGIRIDAYNPVRGYIASESATYYGNEQAAIPAAGAPVKYENRHDSYGALSNWSFAGWYYISVSVSAEVGDFTEGRGVPVTMRTTVKGEPQEGPAYDGDAEAAGFGVSDEDLAAAEEGQTASEAESSGNMKAVAYVGIGAGVVLLLGLGGWMLLARRGSPAGAGAGAGAPVPPAAPGAPTQTAPYTYNGNGGNNQQQYGGPQPPPGPQGPQGPQNWQR